MGHKKTNDKSSHPAKSEIKIAEAASPWETLEHEKVQKSDGSLKKWFIHTDGLRYNRP